MGREANIIRCPSFPWSSSLVNCSIVRAAAPPRDLSAFVLATALSAPTCTFPPPVPRQHRAGVVGAAHHCERLGARAPPDHPAIEAVVSHCVQLRRKAVPSSPRHLGPMIWRPSACSETTPSSPPLSIYSSSLSPEHPADTIQLAQIYPHVFAALTHSSLSTQLSLAPALLPCATKINE